MIVALKYRTHTTQKQIGPIPITIPIPITNNRILENMEIMTTVDSKMASPFSLSLSGSGFLSPLTVMFPLAAQ